jgi:hypothetical protein
MFLVALGWYCALVLGHLGGSDQVAASTTGGPNTYGNKIRRIEYAA